MTPTPDPDPVQNEQPSLAAPHRTYVHRPELEEKFKDFVLNGAKVIVLHGLPGMGKTWLAEQLTCNQVTGEPAPFIDASRREGFSGVIKCASLVAGLDPPDSSDPVVQLTYLACSEHAPPFIVLDNLDSANELTALLPRHTKSVIVATSRRAVDPPTAFQAIHIDRMERAQSRDMARLQLPTLSDEDVEFLASAFGDYPLLINHMRAFYPHQSASMVISAMT